MICQLAGCPFEPCVPFGVRCFVLCMPGVHLRLCEWVLGVQPWPPELQRCVPLRVHQVVALRFHALHSGASQHCFRQPRAPSHPPSCSRRPELAPDACKSYCSSRSRARDTEMLSMASASSVFVLALLLAVAACRCAGELQGRVLRGRTGRMPRVGPSPQPAGGSGGGARCEAPTGTLTHHPLPPPPPAARPRWCPATCGMCGTTTPPPRPPRRLSWSRR